jgi:hypothetical protein
MLSKLSAEFVGTFWLVLGGCGSAVLAAAFPAVGIGLLGVSLAFGLTVLPGAYALGPISDGHFNPAVSDSGSAAIGADGSKVIVAIADAIKKDSLKASITGYTDKTGDAAKNEALAENRAVAVRDALVAAGVPEASIQMKPPMFVDVGAGTTDAEARRVEITRE